MPARILRSEYEAVKPAWHMNKKHWNSIYIHTGIDDKLIYQWVADSYHLVKKNVRKK